MATDVAPVAVVGLPGDAESARPPDAVPAAARWFVRLFLTAFVICGLVGIEAWPLTGWRLFSHVRPSSRTGWQATVVDRDGRERPFSFRRLEPADRAFLLLMKTFPSMTAEHQQAVCNVWLGLARREQPNASGLRLYLATWRLVPRRGRRAADPGTRTLRYACGDTRVVSFEP